MDANSLFPSVALTTLLPLGTQKVTSAAACMQQLHGIYCRSSSGQIWSTFVTTKRRTDTNTRGSPWSVWHKCPFPHRRNSTYVNNAAAASIKLQYNCAAYLQVPFLPFRLPVKKKSASEEGRVIYALCRQCACLQTQRVCAHRQKEREWHSTYTIDELDYAKALGYSFRYHELLLWEKSATYLKPISQLLMIGKMSNSSVPAGLTPESYAAEVNESLALGPSDPFCVLANDIVDDAQTKSLFKQMSTSLFGKFAARQGHSTVQFLRSPSELAALIRPDCQLAVTALNIISPDLVAVTTEPKKPRQFNPRGNVAITALINANSSIRMHKVLLAFFLDSEVAVLSQHCDGFFVATKNSAETRLAAFGCGVGAFRYELDQKILTYSAIGSRQYSITYENEDGTVQHKGSTCGINLESQLAHDDDSQAHFGAYIREALQQKMHGSKGMNGGKTSARQTVRAKDASSSHFATRAATRIISFPKTNLFFGRVFKVTPNGNMYSVPHGYTHSMRIAAAAAADARLN